MELQREKEVVSFYHYDARNFDFEAKNGTPETRINVQVHLLDADATMTAQDTKIQLTLAALIVLDNFVLSSSLSQISIMKGKRIMSREELVQSELEELAAPLFDLLKRLTYELTEVALDEPGLKLEF
ncbi:MAG: DUF1149 family protein [Streptococcaceae bacterium]|jgi:hypothetical protein|nr:DUF1149 family protein [Streptococcaceae bacterium]